jgi:hypothetical protein
MLKAGRCHPLGEEQRRGPTEDREVQPFAASKFRQANEAGTCTARGVEDRGRDKASVPARLRFDGPRRLSWIDAATAEIFAYSINRSRIDCCTCWRNSGRPSRSR